MNDVDATNDLATMGAEAARIFNATRAEIDAFNAKVPPALQLVFSINLKHQEDAPPAAMNKEQWAEALDLRATWLAPLKPELVRLETLAANKRISDADFLRGAEQILKTFPELHLDPRPLAESLAARMTAGAASARPASRDPSGSP